MGSEKIGSVRDYEMAYRLWGDSRVALASLTCYHFGYGKYVRCYSFFFSDFNRKNDDEKCEGVAYTCHSSFSHTTTGSTSPLIGVFSFPRPRFRRALPMNSSIVSAIHHYPFSNCTTLIFSNVATPLESNSFRGYFLPRGWSDVFGGRR